MGTSDNVMIVVTHPTHPLTEDEYNEWYSYNHLPYVLFSEDFPSASRFKQTKVLKGKMTPYLAFYQADWADSWDAQTAYASVGAQGIGQEWNLTPGTSLTVDSWAYYEKLAEAGNPSPDVDPPNAILVTFTEPDGGMGNVGIFLAGAVEAWSKNFLEDMNNCPLVRGSTLYRLGLRAGGENAYRYMTITELNTPKGESGDQIHAGIMDWMKDADLSAAPAMMIEPTGPVGLEYWAYYDRIVTQIKASEEDLLEQRGDGVYRGGIA